ncbi:unnamed protein product, partial [Laminaria digitata]
AARWEREVGELRARLSKADEDHAQTLQAATGAQERAAAALSEAQGTAQVAAWEANTLRAELETLQNHSAEQTAELSSAVEDARSRGSKATKAAEEGAKGELDGLREAVLAAETGKEKALEEMSRMKEKRKKDLQ